MLLRSSFHALACALARPLLGGFGCCLVLHRVIPEAERSALPSNRALEITPENLRDILGWLRTRGVEVIALEEVPARLAGPRAPRFVCFTLDDGYRDNLQYALPVFREFAAPCAVNITNGFADRTASVWWYFLEEALGAVHPLRFAWAGADYEFTTESRAERQRALDEISALLRGLGTTRDELLARIGDAAGVDPRAATRQHCLDWDEVRRLAGDPLVTIGAHTVAHHSLNRLSEAQIVAEVDGGRRALAEQLGREVRHFAFPFGGPNAVGEREFAIVGRCGFTTTLTTRATNLTRRHATPPVQIPRLTLSGNYPPLPAVRRLESGLAAFFENSVRRRWHPR